MRQISTVLLSHHAVALTAFGQCRNAPSIVFTANSRMEWRSGHKKFLRQFLVNFELSVTRFLTSPVNKSVSNDFYTLNTIALSATRFVAERHMPKVLHRLCSALHMLLEMLVDDALHFDIVA